MNLNKKDAYKLFSVLESKKFPEDVRFSCSSIYLFRFFYEYKNVYISSQNVSSNENGAFTGEFSAEMFSSLNLKYSIIGHS